MSNASWWAISLVLLLESAKPSCSLDAENSKEALAQGRALLERNCADCMGATKEGALEGVRKLEDFVQQGSASHEEQVEAYSLLDIGYRMMAFAFSEPDSAEMQRYRDKLQDALKELVRLEPERMDFLYDYSETLRSNSEKVAIWEKIIENDLSFLDAQAALGEYLIEQGSTEEGLAKLKIAFEQSEEVQASRYGQRLWFALESLERHEEAKKLRTILDTLPVE